MKHFLAVISVFCLSTITQAREWSANDVKALPIVQSGLICADDTTGFYAMDGLNNLMNNKVDDNFVVILDQTNKKLGRVPNGKVRNFNITTYSSKTSAIGTRFLACALVSSEN